jgi:hypothetical protein
MCFTLYAGTSNPLPRKAFNNEAPDICVESLNEQDAAARKCFSLPEVQYIGSTSNCGCDFPHAMYQNGGWPFFRKDEDAEQLDSDTCNKAALVHLLESTKEKRIEVYGVWNGDFSEPKAREEISLEDILSPDFYFKEQGFYTVSVDNEKATS